MQVQTNPEIFALTGTPFPLSVSSSLEHLQLKRWSGTLLMKTVDITIAPRWITFTNIFYPTVTMLYYLPSMRPR